MLDTERSDEPLDGVVLMDLPDHDSTEVAHHLEVDRLVELADLLVWVLDPQKYADAAIHDRYLAPLKTHAGVMLVVLNHIDTVPEDRRQSMVDDVRRLLDNDGLQTVPVVAISARQGIGVEDLRAEIARRVAAKRLMRERIEADLRSAAFRIDTESGGGKARELPPRRGADLEKALAEASGVPVVVDAVQRSVRSRAGRAVAWPPFALLAGGSDPLKRLDLDVGGAAAVLTGRGSAVPSTTPVQRPRVDSELRALGDDVAAGLGTPWTAAVRRAATARSSEVGDRLDAALAAADLGVARLPFWVTVVRLLQWLLVLGAVGGAVWTVVTAVGGTLSDVAVAGAPLPVVVLVACVVLGLVLWLACRGPVATLARARSEAADAALRASVHEVSAELVLTPVAGELAAHATMKKGLVAALRQ